MGRTSGRDELGERHVAEAGRDFPNITILISKNIMFGEMRFHISAAEAAIEHFVVLSCT